jgi:hypothetical protein
MYISASNVRVKTKQNKEPEPQQLTAFTPIAASQECLMTVIKFDLQKFKCFSLQC